MHRSSGPAGTCPTSFDSPSSSNLNRVQTDVPIEFGETETHCSPFADCTTAGSLFSIHSAPPVPLADLGTVQATNSLGFEIGCDSPRRPISLAIDQQQQYLSNKTIAAFQQLQASEPDEEDNENLLTVSSLTARPLIAKSRELRTTKYESPPFCGRD